MQPAKKPSAIGSKPISSQSLRVAQAANGPPLRALESDNPSPVNHVRSQSMQPHKHQPPKLTYSIRECCQVTSLGRTTIYAHIAAQRLKAVRVGGRTIIPAESLHALISGEM